MTVYNKTPMARKAAWSYCRRALAVMLCCVLVFGFTVRTTPRAEAAVGVVAAAVFESGVAVSELPGAATALLSIIGLGVDMQTQFDDKAAKIEEAERLGYTWGAGLEEYLQNGECTAEWNALVEKVKAGGGLKAGDSFTLSPKLAEAIRTWTLAKFDFLDGTYTAEDYVIETPSGYPFVLSDVDTSALDAATSNKFFDCEVRRVGTLVRFHVGDYSQSYDAKDYITDDIYCYSKYTLTAPASEGGRWSGSVVQRWYLPGFSSAQIVSAGLGTTVSAHLSKADAIEALQKSINGQSSFGILFYSSEANRVYCGTYNAASGVVRAGSKNYCDLSAVAELGGVETTLTKTPALDKPITEAKTVTIPADMPVTNIGDWTVPVIDNLSPDVLTGEGEGGNTGEDVKPPSTIPWGELRDLLGGISDKVGALPGDIAGSLGDVLTGGMSDAMANALEDTMAKSKAEALARAQEAALDEAMEDPDSLGAVFISKFPFCIPWDVAKAVSLLAAPPVTPRWELDFMEPVARRTGVSGDTTVVIDMSDYELVGVVTRWTSTIMFIYALASGTKRLIWTA